MRISHLPLGLLRLALPVLLVACGSPGEEGAARSVGSAVGPPPAGLPAPTGGQAGPGTGVATPPFAEVAEAVGLRFTHVNGMTGAYYFHEMMGAGAALFDYDNDGDLDVYLVQGHSLDGSGAAPSDRLFRNDLALLPGGDRRLSFTDVTEASGIEATGYGMGAATGDYDGDGWTDLYVTNFEANQLWRNRGDGTFEEKTEEAGVGDRRWSVPALFFDYDGDGALDLFVGNYVDFTLETHKRCTTPLGAPNYCGPLSFRPYRNALFRNRGDGTFEDVTGRSGLAEEAGGALGAISGDFDGDGLADLYVANDGLPNHLWLNNGDGTFRDEALLAGAALNATGSPEASMGIDAADYDFDGDEDLFLTHLSRESNTLYENRGDGTFEDASTASGLALASWDETGFGTAWLDYDRDGDLDLLAVNGAVRVIEELARAGDPFPLHQKNQLFRNDLGTYVDVSAEAGPPFAHSEVSRGAAFGDLDNDGDTDVLITNNNGPVRLLLNQAPPTPPWVGVRAVTGAAGRDALGAWVGVGRRQPPGASSGRPARVWRRVRTAASYASANDPRLLFPLAGPLAELVGEPAEGSRYTAVVRWPEGGEEELFDLEVDAYTTVRRGTGRPAGGS